MALATRLTLALATAAVLGLAPPTKVATVAHLNEPVAVLPDPDEDLYLVANINGEGTAHDNNGYISRVSPTGKVVTPRFIEGGHNGVTLDAPKGLALVGSTLWVADIDVVRAFDRHTGRPIRTVQMPAPGGLFLNEMTVGPDQAVYVTDTRLEFHGDLARHLGPDRVFRIGADGSATIALTADLEAPSGIVWDAVHSRFLIVALQGTHIFEWRPGQTTVSPVWQGIGGYDGIVIDGPRWLVSSLTGRGIYDIRNGREVRIIDGLDTPASIGFDVGRRQLLIPSFSANAVQIWNVGSS